MREITGRKKNIVLALFGVGWVLALPLGWYIGKLIIWLEKH